MPSKKQIDPAVPANKKADTTKKQNASFKNSTRSINLDELELSDEWLDVQEMKQLFKVTSHTLRNWHKRGYLKPSKIGRNFYYNRAMVRAMLVNNMI